MGIDDLKKKEDQIAIHCSTKEDFIECCKIFNSHLSSDLWDVYTNNTMMFPYSHCYGDVDYCKRNNVMILKFLEISTNIYNLWL